jgi:RecA-family ATPase
LFYHCFHNSCKPCTWREARQRISGNDSLSQFFATKPKAESNIRENFYIITANDIMESAKEEAPIIKGLLTEMENLLIVGPSGIGKSLLTLNIGLNLGMPAANKSLWGIFNIPNQFKTLFIQSENSLLGIRKRLGLIFKGNEAYKKARRCLIFPGINGDCRISGNVTDPYFQDFLREMIYATDSKVVVVDPLISFHHANENDNAEMRKYLDTLMSICIETQTSLILIHHVGKASSGAVGGGRGASSIGDWADNVLSLEPGKDNILKVSHQKGRYFSEHPEFYLERTATLDFKRVTPDFDDEGEMVKEALAALGGTAKTQEMLAEKMVEMGCSSKPKAKRWIKKAKNSGMVEEVRNGKAVGYKLNQS